METLGHLSPVSNRNWHHSVTTRGELDFRPHRLASASHRDAVRDGIPGRNLLLSCVVFRGSGISRVSCFVSDTVEYRACACDSRCHLPPASSNTIFQTHQAASDQTRMNVTQGEALSTPKTPAIDPIMPESHALHRNLRLKFPLMVRGEGIYLFDKNGQKYLDASGGASVVTLGHNDPRVNEAVYGQMKKLSYCATTHFSNEPYEKLCDFLIDSTQGRMALAYILNSGLL